MPWECKTVEKQRLEFVTKALETNNFSALCREYEITRKTGRKWVDRFKQGLPLTDMSRRPLCSPNKTPDDIEELIVSVRFDNPGWGDDKIKIFLENQGYKNIPCPRTITNILHKHQLISEEESLKRKPFKRFQKEHCNDMWQTDFKGEFLTADNRYCYPLTILDDSSRYSIKIAHAFLTLKMSLLTLLSKLFMSLVCHQAYFLTMVLSLQVLNMDLLCLKNSL